MAVSTPQGTATANGNTSSLSTGSITVSGSNIVGIIAVRWSSGTISSATWNGTSMTLVPNTSGGDGSNNTAIYYLAGAATGVATVNFSGMQQCSIKAYYFTDADQSTSVRNGTNANAASGAPSQSVSSATGNQVIDVISSSNSPTIGGGQTAIGTEVAQGGFRQNDSYEAGATSVTMSWSGINESHSHSACDIMAAGGSNQNIDGNAVFAPTLSFPTGKFTHYISGDASFTPALSFPTGKFAHYVSGDAVFAPALSFNDGTVTQRLPGDAVFAPALSFPNGKFTHNVVGDAVFIPALSFFDGNVATVIGGDAVFAPGLSFFDGTLSQRVNADAVFQPTLSFPTGKFTHNVVGDAVFVPALSFPTGQMQWTAAGDAVFTPGLSFFDGALHQYIQGDAVFGPSLFFPNGSVTLDVPAMDLWLLTDFLKVW